MNNSDEDTTRVQQLERIEEQLEIAKKMARNGHDESCTKKLHYIQGMIDGVLN